MRPHFSGKFPLPLILVGISLQGCSTTYRPPVWEGSSYSDSALVKAHIDAHLATYGQMMNQMAGGKDAAAITTIATALVGTTAMALGAGTDVGILAGSVGAGVSATNNYAKPADRLELLGHAVNATTCIRDEYSNQTGRGEELGFSGNAFRPSTNLNMTVAQTYVANNGHLKRQLGDAGQIAIDATRTVSSSLQVKLVNLSKVPDYGDAVKAIQEAQKAADANKPGADTPATAALLVNQIAEYEKRIEECKAKLPS